jgi:hypothetical protein
MARAHDPTSIPSSSTSRVRAKALPLVAFLLLSFTPPNPPPTYALDSFGETVAFLVPAHDPTVAPEFSISTQVTVDLEFDYAVTNNGSTQAFVQLCGSGSTQSVELFLDDGTPVGLATFPLMPVSLVAQPGTTVGPSAVVVKNLAFIWQTHLGNLPATEGPPGTDIKMLATFPRVIFTTNSGCRVQQALHVSARVHVNIS